MSLRRQSCNRGICAVSLKRSLFQRHFKKAKTFLHKRHISRRLQAGLCFDTLCHAPLSPCQFSHLRLYKSSIKIAVRIPFRQNKGVRAHTHTNTHRQLWPRLANDNPITNPHPSEELDPYSRYQLCWIDWRGNLTTVPVDEVGDPPSVSDRLNRWHVLNTRRKWLQSFEKTEFHMSFYPKSDGGDLQRVWLQSLEPRPTFCFGCFFFNYATSCVSIGSSSSMSCMTWLEWTLSPLTARGCAHNKHNYRRWWARAPCHGCRGRCLSSSGRDSRFYSAAAWLEFRVSAGRVRYATRPSLALHFLLPSNLSTTDQRRLDL